VADAPADPADTCLEGVTRRGEFQPCEKTAVALRIDPTEGLPYPVCAYHARADMVPLADIVAERDRLAAQLAAVRDMAQRAIRVNFRGPHDTDAAMMLGAADKLDQGFEVGGSNVREAVARTLRFATALSR
jgi:hypothetical protein